MYRPLLTSNPGESMKREAKLGSTRGFRPWPKNRERLEFAEKFGLNCSEIINQVLEKHLKDALETALKTRQSEIREALAAKVP